MHRNVLLLASASFVGGAALTYAVERVINAGAPQLALIVGALLASQVAAWRLAEQPSVELSFVIKAQVGLVVAATCIVFALILQAILHWLPFPEVTIPISAFGSFIFPVFLMTRTFRSVRETKNGGTTSGA